ncbi:hypothetical protein [Nocardioides zeae]
MHVTADSPSAAADPHVFARLGTALVSWRPERGWLCSEHHSQPCTHTADLTVEKDPRWNQ